MEGPPKAAPRNPEPLQQRLRWFSPFPTLFNRAGLARIKAKGVSVHAQASWASDKQYPAPSLFKLTILDWITVRPKPTSSQISDCGRATCCKCSATRLPEIAPVCRMVDGSQSCISCVNAVQQAYKQLPSLSLHSARIPKTHKLWTWPRQATTCWWPATGSNLVYQQDRCRCGHGRQLMTSSLACRKLSLLPGQSCNSLLW